MEHQMARQTDPDSSHEAARRAKKQFAKAQRVRVYEGLLAKPGLTSAELGVVMGMDRYAVARRLPELLKEGHAYKSQIRKCRISRRRAVTWHPDLRPDAQTMLKELTR